MAVSQPIIAIARTLMSRAAVHAGFSWKHANASVHGTKTPQCTGSAGQVCAVQMRTNDTAQSVLQHSELRAQCSVWSF